MSGEDKFDGIFTQILNEKQGYEGFFDVVLSFLRRKSDFFVNSKQGEQIIAKLGKLHTDRYYKEKEEEEKEKALRESRKKTTQQTEATPAAIPSSKDVTNGNKETPIAESGNDKKEEKLAPNKGNGSSTPAYYWTQTLEEVTAQIPLDAEDSKKTLNVDLGITHCKISRKDGSKVYVDDEWCNKIHVDESSWVIVNDEKGRTFQLTLLKWKNDTMWWDCFVKSEPKIDTQKVNPEPGKLSDLDGEARTTVEKMMFDMRQKQMGLPTSEELEKKDKLKDFMKAHPELDFSKAKFS